MKGKRLAPRTWLLLAVLPAYACAVVLSPQGLVGPAIASVFVVSQGILVLLLEGPPGLRERHPLGLFTLTGLCCVVLVVTIWALHFAQGWP